MYVAGSNEINRGTYDATAVRTREEFHKEIEGVHTLTLCRN